MLKSNSSTAVVLASNVCNSGMFSVDLAARQYFASRGGANFFVAHPERRRDRLFYGGVLTERYSVSEQLRDFDRIVFWGDFVLNPMYGASDFVELDMFYGLSRSSQEAFERWQQLFMLRRFDKQPGQKLVSFGGNFMSPDVGFGDGFTNSDYSRELGRFDAIFPRDPDSYKTLHEYVPSSLLTQGVDAAFLLRCGNSRPPKRPGFFVYFFHRSGIPNPDRLVRKIEQMTGLNGVCLDHWLTLHGLRNQIRCAVGRYTTFRWYRYLMRRAAFTVSDTYHLCINSLGVGTPCVGIGVAEGQTDTCSDKKKRVLFESLDMSDAYVEIQSPSDNSLIERIHLVLGRSSFSRSGLSPQFCSLQDQVQRVKAKLDSALGF